MAASLTRRGAAAFVVLLSGCSGTDGSLSDFGEVGPDTGLRDARPVDSGPDAGDVVLQIVGMEVPPAELGEAYTATITASEPASWAITENNLPTGLQLVGDATPTVLISGRAFAPGQFSVELTATAAGGAQAILQLSIDVLGTPPLPLTITPTTAPDALVGSAYEHTFEAVGGFDPVSWDPPGLPPGLQAEVRGRTMTITSTPTPVANAAITLRVTDAAMTSTGSEVAIRILEPSLAFDNPMLPAAQLGTPYSAELNVTGASAPYTWRLVGMLPNGLSFSSQGTAATIAGAPTVEGNFEFGVLVQSGPEQLQADLSIDVLQPLTILAPNSVAIQPCGPIGANQLSVANPTPNETVQWSVISGPDGVMVRNRLHSEDATLIGHVRPPVGDVVVQARQGDRYGTATIAVTTRGPLPETRYIAVTTGATVATSLHLVDVCSSTNPQAILLTSELTHPAAYELAADGTSLVYMAGPTDEAELWIVRLQPNQPPQPAARIVSSPGPGRGVRDFAVSPNSSGFIAVSADLAIDDVFEAWVAGPTPTRVHPPLTSAHQGVMPGSLRYTRFNSTFFFVADVEAPGALALYLAGGVGGLGRIGTGNLSRTTVVTHPSQQEALIVADMNQIGRPQLFHYLGGIADTLTPLTSTTAVASHEHFDFVGNDIYFVAREPAAGQANLFRWNAQAPSGVVVPMLTLNATEDVTRLQHAPNGLSVGVEVTDQISGTRRLLVAGPAATVAQPVNGATDVAADWSVGCSENLAFVDQSLRTPTYQESGGSIRTLGSASALNAASIFFVFHAPTCSELFVVGTSDQLPQFSGVGLVDNLSRDVSHLSGDVVPGPTGRAARSSGFGLFYLSRENGRQVLYGSDLRESGVTPVPLSYDVGSLSGLNVLTVAAKSIR